jgi:hypothetical protein
MSRQAYLWFDGFNPAALTLEASNLFTFASTILSANEHPFPPLSSQMMPIGRALCERVKIEPHFPNADKMWQYRYDPVKPSSRAFVGFSGGKDCAAAAIKLMRRGMEVSLIYVHGINTRIPGDIQNATAAAKLLGCPLHVISMTPSRNGDCFCNPVRNIAILSAMADMARGEVGTLALGTFVNDPVADIPLNNGNWSDGFEVMEMTKAMIESVKPGMTVETRLHDSGETLLYVYEHSRELLLACTSCNRGAGLKSIYREANRKKYGIELPARYCGSCHKCCAEYYILNQVGDPDYQNASFAAHCAENLKSVARVRTAEAQQQHGKSLVKMTDDEALDFYVDRKAIEAFKSRK